MRLEATHHAILACIAEEGAAHGNLITSRLARRTNGSIMLGGGLYSFLRELERAKLLASVEDRRPEVMALRGGRPRIVYDVTAEGRKAIA